MTSAAELDQISADLFVWHRYDPAVKAELFSTGLGTAAGFWLIDPTPIDSSVLGTATGGRAIQGTIVTNVNHWRGAGELSAMLGAGVFAHDDARAEFERTAVAVVTEIASELEVIPIAGAPRGEVAIYSREGAGTLVMGDALINMGAYGFTFLPAKYCEDQKLMRRSLRRLLDCQFERLLFAHGTPITTGARGRLAALLEGGA